MRMASGASEISRMAKMMVVELRPQRMMVGASGRLNPTRKRVERLV